MTLEELAVLVRKLLRAEEKAEKLKTYEYQTLVKSLRRETESVVTSILSGELRQVKLFNDNF